MLRMAVIDCSKLQYFDITVNKLTCKHTICIHSHTVLTTIFQIGGSLDFLLYLFQTRVSCQDRPKLFIFPSRHPTKSFSDVYSLYFHLLHCRTMLDPNSIIFTFFKTFNTQADWLQSSGHPAQCCNCW